MPETRVEHTKDVKVEIKHPDTNESLGFLTVEIRESWWVPEKCDGYTEEECKIEQYGKKIYCYAQIATGTPQNEPKKKIKKRKLTKQEDGCDGWDW